jgi:plastocyanin
MKNTLKWIAVVGAICVAVATAPANAADWGSIKGRIVVDGTPAKPAPLVVTKDEFCIDKKPENKSIVIGKDNALENVFVYLRVPAGQKVEVNPEYASKEAEPITLDNNGCEFHPHAILARVGQTLDIKNSDPVGHNTNVNVLSFNQVIPSNSDTKVKVSAGGALPTEVACNIHPFMKAYLLVQDHPYMATTGDDGTFEIKNIPAGKREFQFWHEAGGFLKNVKLKGGTTNAKGRVELNIEAGKTLDVGDIKVPASALK